MVGFSLLAGFLLARALNLRNSHVHQGDRGGHAKAQLCTSNIHMSFMGAKKPVFDKKISKKNVHENCDFFFNFLFFSSSFSFLTCLFSASFWRGNQVDGLPRRFT